MTAAARFVCSRPETGGDDWISKLLSVAAPVMARREQGLPRHVLVRVSDDRVELLHGSKQIASWHRGSVRATTADSEPRRWKVWMVPPGDRQAFELQARRGGRADEVVAALLR